MVSMETHDIGQFFGNGGHPVPVKYIFGVTFLVFKKATNVTKVPP
jgi:hypothetical protein